MRVPEGERLYRGIGSEGQRIEVYAQGSVRSLYLGSGALQSQIDMQQPQRLLLPYMQAMMAVRLFCHPPKDILLLGVGAGALAQHLIAQWPDASLVGVEREAQLSRVADVYFGLPLDAFDYRIDDAEHFVGHDREGYDLLLIDLYGRDAMPGCLYNASFLGHCRARMRRGGILVLNLVANSEEAFVAVLKPLRECFSGYTLCLPVPGYRNVIVFAFVDPPLRCSRDALMAGALRLEKASDLPFKIYLERLFDTNPLDATGALWMRGR